MTTIEIIRSIGYHVLVLLGILIFICVAIERRGGAARKKMRSILSKIDQNEDWFVYVLMGIMIYSLIYIIFWVVDKF